jgi:hypothetical protein
VRYCFYYPKWGVAPKPQSLFAHEGLFLQGIRELASLGSLTKKVIKKDKKFPRQSASLTRRQRLKSVQGFHFSLRLCLPLLAKISGGVLFFQGYFISNFAVMKIALVEMKIGKAYSLPLVRLSVRKRRGKGGKHTRAEIIWVVFP